MMKPSVSTRHRREIFLATSPRCKKAGNSRPYRAVLKGRLLGRFTNFLKSNKTLCFRVTPLSSGQFKKPAFAGVALLAKHKTPAPLVSNPACMPQSKAQQCAVTLLGLKAHPRHTTTMLPLQQRVEEFYGNKSKSRPCFRFLGWCRCL